MIPRRIILASIFAVSVVATGCIKDAAKTLGELHGVRGEINKKFGEDVNVHLSQGGSLSLTITFINSALNEKTPAERARRAEETAQAQPRVADGLKVAYDVRRLRLLPRSHGSLDQRGSIAEVPIETALRGPDTGGDGLDGHRRDPSFGDCLERSASPVLRA